MSAKKNKRKKGISFSKKFFFTLLLVLIFFGTIEISLRIFNYRYSTTPLSVEYVEWIKNLGDKTFVPGKGIVITTFHKDKDLFWFPDAGTTLTNSLGFRGPEISEKKSDIIRIVCMGDSVPQNGFPSYPRLLEKLLNENSRKFEVINAGIGSYSSYQGLVLLRKKILKLKPDIVTVQFGWNDHWAAWSHSDKELAKYWKFVGLRNFLGKFRFYQLFADLINSFREKTTKNFSYHPRVSPEEYRENLTEMIKLSKKHGFRLIFITAPTVLKANHPTAIYLARGSKLFPDPKRLNSVHAFYNEVLRSVARENGIEVLDLERIFENSPSPEKYFLKDGIHFCREGIKKTALLLKEKILKKN